MSAGDAGSDRDDMVAFPAGEPSLGSHLRVDFAQASLASLSIFARQIIMPLKIRDVPHYCDYKLVDC
jgi:hypothetical protein